MLTVSNDRQYPALGYGVYWSMPAGNVEMDPAVVTEENRLCAYSLLSCLVPWLF